MKNCFAMKIWMLCVTLLLFSFPAYSANKPTITTGAETGKYYKVGIAMSSLLRGGMNVATSAGSVENMERIMSGEAQFGIVQMDAYADFIGSDPKAAEALEILGPLYEECVFIAVHKDSSIKTEDDLQDAKKKHKIAIGEQGSGTAVTWKYMTKLEPKYQSAVIDYSGGQRALGRIAASPEAGAVMFVTIPDLNGTLPKTALNSGLRFIKVNDSDLNNKLPQTGKPVYEFKTIKASGGFFADKVETICTDAVVITRKDVETKVVNGVVDIVLNQKTTLLQK